MCLISELKAYIACDYAFEAWVMVLESASLSLLASVIISLWNNSAAHTFSHLIFYYLIALEKPLYFGRHFFDKILEDSTQQAHNFFFVKITFRSISARRSR